MRIHEFPGVHSKQGRGDPNLSVDHRPLAPFDLFVTWNVLRSIYYETGNGKNNPVITADHTFVMMWVTCQQKINGVRF